MEVAENPCWYVVHTHPKQEERTRSNFEMWGLETFLPLFRGRRYNHFTGDISYIVKPLFQRYIFVRFRLSEAYNRIRFTRGVHSLVSFASNPCPVDDEIINLIRFQVDADGLVKIGEELKPGDRVIIRGGPLSGLSGIFEREMSDDERVAVLLDSVIFQGRVMAERHTLEKVC